MNKKSLTIGLSVLLLGTVVWIAGCKKEADAVSPTEAKACPADCTKSCCADKDAAAKTCPADCTKPCCADKDAAAKTCPADCTKPCCADKDAEAKTCPADCAKPCCAAKTVETAAEEVKETAGQMIAKVKKVTEQTVCPIMGKPINKDISLEYKGQKVYFCCPGCIDAFNKEPEKYTKGLPQLN